MMPSESSALETFLSAVEQWSALIESTEPLTPIEFRKRLLLKLAALYYAGLAFPISTGPAGTADEMWAEFDAEHSQLVQQSPTSHDAMLAVYAERQARNEAFGSRLGGPFVYTDALDPLANKEDWIGTSSLVEALIHVDDAIQRVRRQPAQNRATVDGEHWHQMFRSLAAHIAQVLRVLTVLRYQYDENGKPRYVVDFVVAESGGLPSSDRYFGESLAHCETFTDFLQLIADLPIYAVPAINGGDAIELDGEIPFALRLPSESVGLHGNSWTWPDGAFFYVSAYAGAFPTPVNKLEPEERMLLTAEGKLRLSLHSGHSPQPFHANLSGALSPTFWLDASISAPTESRRDELLGALASMRRARSS